MFTLSSIRSSTALRAPRIVLLGVEKIGKTSFACGSRVEDGRVVEFGLNSPVVLQMKGEEGVDGLPNVKSFPVISTHSEIMEAMDVLYENDHPYRTLVFDSASTAAHIINDGVCEENGVDSIRKMPGFRTGEAAVINKWREILDGMDHLRDERNMSIIITGHVKVKAFKNPEGDNYDTYDLDLEHTDVSEMLKRWADLILFANTKVLIKKEGEDTKFSKAKRRGIDASGGARWLYTQKRPAHPGGGRNIYGALPYEIPLDWASFEEAVAAAQIPSAEQNQESEKGQ